MAVETVDSTTKIQIEKGATATAYAPYANIRPIHGRDSVKVERCGENLLDGSKWTAKTNAGVTYEPTGDGGIYCHGTATATSDSPTFDIRLRPGAYISNLSGTKYPWLSSSGYVVVKPDGSRLWLSTGGGFTIAEGDVGKYFYFAVKAGETVDEIVYPMLVPGTTVPTTYVPYTGQTTVLTLPSTVYGGEVDAVSGEGQETWETVTLDGTENWEKVTNVQNPYFRASILHLGAVTLGSLAAKCTAFPLVEINGNNSNNGFNGRDASLYIRWASLSTVDVLKSYLASQYAAGTPVQICYKPKKPVPFTATGAQPMPALAGVNTVLTDADSATVTGRADPIKRIADLENKE